ncbi:anthranilate synthase component I [Methanosarcina sp. Mfa9]|uniref:anthranilate synthase component I n=1 Tax=Methanosarcina sp. Mfa9 TaxID=3439063 RepID=UPI003F84AB1E
MFSFDLGKEEFEKLVSGLEKPAIVQLLAKVDSARVRNLTPLQLYRTLKRIQDAGQQGTEKQGKDQSADKGEGCPCYSYMLESVEKEKTKARYSFVGSDPDAVLTIKDREISVELLKKEASSLFEQVRKEITEGCRDPETGENTIRAAVPPGKDLFDALRLAFPTADGIGLLNSKRFDRQTFLGGAIGFTAYDAIYDSWLDTGKGFESDVPELQYLLVSKSFVFDHLTGDIYIVLTPFIRPGSDPEALYGQAVSEAEKLYTLLEKAVREEGKEKEKGEEEGSEENFMESPASISRTSPPAPVPGVEESERAGFEAAVLQAKEHIFAGDIFQVVLSRKREFQLKESPFELYTRLRAINPSPYMYLFEFGDLAIVGASPETLLTVHERTVITNPIAGTCPRGKTGAEDEELAARMLGDEKERAEHVMLVDLGRNDVRMVAESGSVKVSDFMKVLKYSHVQHIESTVSGKLRPECDQFDAFRAVFPAGTLSGAPKIRAMEIISELENSPRGVYGGGVGYYSWNGDADFAIVIRTVLVRGKLASVQAGAGIVADSDPAYEFRETERKMAAMLRAIEDGA